MSGRTFWIYILKCADGSYYTGHMDDLEPRIAAHQTGAIKSYTSRRLPVRLVYSEQFATRAEALEQERRIKGWSRAKKEALIRSDWTEISRLARKHKSVA
jgi:predicted GIY-YIG superfamily endonuclease